MKRIALLLLLVTACCAAQRISSGESAAKARVDAFQRSTAPLIAKGNEAIADINARLSRKGNFNL